MSTDFCGGFNWETAAKEINLFLLVQSPSNDLVSGNSINVQKFYKYSTNILCNPQHCLKNSIQRK